MVTREDEEFAEADEYLHHNLPLIHDEDEPMVITLEDPNQPLMYW